MKLFLIVFVALVSYTVGRRSSSKYEWTPELSWTGCDAKCGTGMQYRLYSCIKITVYNTNEFTKSKKCFKKPKPVVGEKCSYGPCPSKKTLTTFVWRTSNWSECTHTCGVMKNYRSRDVDCVAITEKTENGKVKFINRPAKLSQCDANLEPPRFLICLQLSCPPKWKTGKWDPCPISTKCDSQIQRRKVKCTTKMPDGTIKKIRPFLCYHMRPRVWQNCITKSHLKLCSAKETNQQLKEILKLKYDIEEDNSEVYQMRKANKLKITVGQTAYVFSGSRLQLVCPVVEFPMAYVEWEHNGQVYRYSPGGTALGKYLDKNKKTQIVQRNRVIKVYRGGKLRIRRFNVSLHEGVWTCRAGKSTASLTLHHELMSKGFSNWINSNRKVGARSQKGKPNRNKEMFNEQAENGGNMLGFMMPGTVLWIKSSWTKCPDFCLNSSLIEKKEVHYKYRRVSCERVETKFYKVIPDWNCPPPKPRHMRECPVPDSCATWKLVESPQDKCTDKCMGIGTAVTNAKVVCKDKDKVVPDSLCARFPKPYSKCSNSACKVKYFIGSWSKCSLSCSNTTNHGYRSRTLRCVWENNVHKSAGALCRTNNIKKPNVFSMCQVPKCILLCRDLSPVCQSQPQSRCKNYLFLNFCCSFCHSKKYSKKGT